MSEIITWDATAANNNSAPPDGWPEGMNYSDVNNSGRELMAALRRWQNTISGRNVTAGAATAYTVTLPITLTTYERGFVFLLEPHVDSGVAPTLNVNGLGARSLRTANATTVPLGALQNGRPYLCVVDDARITVLNPSNADLLTAGWDLVTHSYKWRGSSAPVAYDVDSLLSDGGAWESFGPTGSGATNIWTALDDMPAETRFITLGTRVVLTSNADGQCQGWLNARPGDTNWAQNDGVAGGHWAAGFSFYADASSRQQIRFGEFTVGLDPADQTFDLVYQTDNASFSDFDIWLKEIHCGEDAS